MESSAGPHPFGCNGMGFMTYSHHHAGLFIAHSILPICAMSASEQVRVMGTAPRRLRAHPKGGSNGRRCKAQGPPSEDHCQLPHKTAAPSGTAAPSSDRLIWVTASGCRLGRLTRLTALGAWSRMPHSPSANSEAAQLSLRTVCRCDRMLTVQVELKH